MLAQLLKILPNSANRERLSWFFGIASALLVGSWTVFTYFAPSEGFKSSQSNASIATQSNPNFSTGRDTNIYGSVIIGVDEKIIGRHIADQKRISEEILAKIAQSKGVEITPLRAILAKLGESNAKEEDVAKRLEEKAEELISLREEVARLKNGPEELVSFADRANLLIGKGQFDEARAALGEGRVAARKLRDRSARYEAQFLTQEARLDHLQLAYRSSASKYAEAARLVDGVDLLLRWRLLMAEGNELRSAGELGDAEALLEAISLLRRTAQIAAETLQPLESAKAQYNLGLALQTLGERSRGDTALQEAASSFIASLKEQTRERAPLDWAKTQNNLGLVFTRLGEKASHSALLHDAINAFNEALKERTRELAPLEWAATQDNLGTALLRLGELTHEKKYLEQAAAAYQEVLKERTRERVPIDWAKTQNNLGIALLRLGQESDDEAFLRDATVALQEALKERTQNRFPLDWAVTQYNLGFVFRILGERNKDEKQLQNAAGIFREAVKVFEISGASRYADITRMNLARTDALLILRAGAKPR